MSFKLNPLFSDNMVLACGRPVRVFGEGDCEVTVSFLGETKTVKCEDGKFLCELYGDYVDSMENTPDFNITVAWDTQKIDF